MSTAPCPFSFQQRKTRFPSRYDPGQTTGFPISCIFSSRAAIARNGLMVEPGAYVPCSPLFCIGLRGVGFSACQSARRVPRAETVGAKPGPGEEARTSPVREARAITAPARSPIASWAVTCRSTSSEVCTVPPVRDGTSSTSRWSLPAASTSTFLPPFTPLRTLSPSRSPPSFPMSSPIISGSFPGFPIPPGLEPLMMGDLIGKYGLERLADNVLRGVNGGRKVEVDAAGRDQRLVEEVPSRTGGTVHTSLDVDLQVTAQEAMGDRAGAVIALAPRTGEVLASSPGPGFAPTVSARGTRRADWQALNPTPRKPMQNKGLQGTYAPGSTIKPFLAMAALEEKMQEIGKPVVCPGSYRLGNRVFRCWKEKGHGAVDMYRAIVPSCAVYFYTP